MASQKGLSKRSLVFFSHGAVPVGYWRENAHCLSRPVDLTILVSNLGAAVCIEPEAAFRPLMRNATEICTSRGHTSVKWTQAICRTISLSFPTYCV
jgi:hypothetical protein